MMKYLLQEECGHYEKQMVKVHNPNYKTKKEMQDHIGDGVFWGTKGRMVRVSSDGMYESVYHGKQPKYITKEENVWIPKYKDQYEERNNTPHYFEIKDGDKVIFTTKDKPLFYKVKYKEENHSKWWDEFDNLSETLREQANDYLNKNYPNWKDVNAYWDI